MKQLPSPHDELPSLQKPIVAGGLVILLGFAGFLLWAALVPLEGGVIASGRLVGETERQTVQHLDGGIVSEILVNEGERVAAGQVLFRLESLADRERVDVFVRKRSHLLVKQARLVALRSGAPAWNPPPDVQAAADRDPALADMVGLQQRLFESERGTLEAQAAVLEQRAQQQSSTIAALEERDAARGRELGIVEGELADMEKLFKKKIVPRTRVTELRREKARLDGMLADTRGMINRAREVIAETRMQLAALRQDAARKWSDELSEIEEALAQTDNELAVARDRLTRQDVVSPTAGTVLNLRYATRGGVVAPGAPIVDIVPADKSVAVELQVRPSDIDEVHAGLPARVRLTALSQRTTPLLEGTVVRVSPDTIFDERKRAEYYTARVDLPADSLTGITGGQKLHPGMPAEVVVVSSHRTLLATLLRPLSDALFRSFRQ